MIKILIYNQYFLLGISGVDHLGYLPYNWNTEIDTLNLEKTEAETINQKRNFKKLYGPFLWMGFNCLKAKATTRRQFTLYH